jgi:hypothetical protein
MALPSNSLLRYGYSNPRRRASRLGFIGIATFAASWHCLRWRPKGAVLCAYSGE